METYSKQMGHGVTPAEHMWKPWGNIWSTERKPTEHIWKTNGKMGWDTYGEPTENKRETWKTKIAVL